MRNIFSFRVAFLLVLVAFAVEGCLGTGGSSSSSSQGNFKTENTGNGQKISVNQASQAVFQGKIYFTQNRNLLVLDGTRTITQLTHGQDVRDPAVSPDGKLVAFDVRFGDSAKLVYMPANGGPQHILIDGNGHYWTNSGGFPEDDYYWLAQPTWSDNTHLTFLSDFQKNFDWQQLGGDFASAPFVDMQIFSISINYTNLTGAEGKADAQIVAYADYGDGGDRDPMYRPGHPTQLIYTHYTYDKTGTNQVIQLYFEDAAAIAKHPGMYSPGVEGSGLDPAVAMTPPDVECIEPAFSPDGNWIAYIRRNPSTNSMGLYVMPMPSGDLTSDPNNPTTQKAAQASYSASSLIIQGQYISQPVWSPNGKQIAFLSYNNNEFDIWLANVSLNPKTGKYAMQGSPIQLTQGGVDADSRPFWTP
jgi:dipeptidyl aminopeptidase/acylaminoacyl peptidase